VNTATPLVDIVVGEDLTASVVGFVAVAAIAASDGIFGQVGP
jgi:hypothetical protein